MKLFEGFNDHISLLQMKVDADMDVFADEHMVEMNRRQVRGVGRRHSRLRSTLSRSPTPSPPTPPLSPATPPATPPSSSPLPGQPVITTLMEGKSGSLDNRENQSTPSAQTANGSEANSRHPDGILKDQQQARNSNLKPSSVDVTKNQPAPFTSSALPDDNKANAVSSTSTPPTGSGSGPPKTPLDKVQQLSRKRERTPSPTLSTGLPNSKRPAVSTSSNSTSGGSNSGSLLEAPPSSTKVAGAGIKNNVKAPSPLPNARVMSSASKVLTEEIQKQQGQENARLKLLIFKEIRKPGKSKYTDCTCTCMCTHANIQHIVAVYVCHSQGLVGCM